MITLLQVHWVRSSDLYAKHLSGIRPVWCDDDQIQETIDGLFAEAISEGHGRTITKIDVLTLVETYDYEV